MPVDEQIRDQLLRTRSNLPEPDTAAALDGMLERAAPAARRRRTLVTGVAASAVVAASALVGSLVLDLNESGAEQLPAPPAAPTGSEQPADIDDRLTRLRDTVHLGVEQLLGPFGPAGSAQTYRWDDTPDSADVGSDIERVRAVAGGTGILHGRRYPAFDLELALADGPTNDRSATELVVEYGIVLDLDGDRVADCELGITTDTAGAGEFRVWAVGLADGRIREHVAPPSIGPFEFYHPHERGEAQMAFLFGNPMPECESASQGKYFYVLGRDVGRR